MPRKNVILWNNTFTFENKIRNILLDSYLHTKKIKMWAISSYDRFSEKYTNINKFIKLIKNKKLNVDAVIRREEHGNRWGSDKDWKQVIEVCYENKILPMSFDYGYFDHYQTYMIDVYSKNAESSIKSDWNTLPTTVDWGKAPEYIKKYRENFLKIYNRAKNNPPIENLKSQEYVIIWMPSDADLLKNQFKENPFVEKTAVSDWINRAIKIVSDSGLTPVIKGCPGLWRRFDISSVKNVKIFACEHRQVKIFKSVIFAEDINPKLLAHAKFNIFSHGSVSNELVLADAPIVALGNSWFNGLGVFNEPTSWDTLLHNATEVNQSNRNKWINWWINRQCLREDAINKIIEIHEKYKL